MSFPLVQALYEALDEVGARQRHWVVVLTGAGRGVLLRPRPPRPRHAAEQPRPRRSRASRCVDVVHERRRARDARHPAADHRRDQRARVRRRHVPHARRRPPLRVRVGRVLLGRDHQRAHVVSELGATYLLPRAVGTSNAAELLLTGRKIDATEALRIGLVSKVVPDDELLDLALDTAEEMTTSSVVLRRDDDEAGDVVEPRDHVARTPRSSSRTATSSSPATPATSTRRSPRSARSARRSTRSSGPADPPCATMGRCGGTTRPRSSGTSAWLRS